MLGKLARRGREGAWGGARGGLEGALISAAGVSVAIFRSKGACEPRALERDS